MNLELLEKNIAAIQQLKCPPALPENFFENLRNPDWVNTEDDITLEYFKSRQGHGVLRLVDEQGRRSSLSNPVDPYREPEKGLGELEREIGDTLALVGFGLGHGARSAIRLFGEHLRLCILEPSQNAFALAMRNEDLTDILTHRFVLLGVDPDKANAYRLSHDAYDTTLSTHLHQVVENYCHLPPLRQKGQIIRESLEDAMMMAQVNYNTGDAGGAQFQRNMMMNLLHGLRSASMMDLADQDFTGRPAIVIAPGPSLKRNVHLLKDLEDRALMLALDTSIKPLLLAGVKPHMICTVDPNPINVKKFPEEGLPPDVGFYGCLDACKEVWDLAPELSFAYHRDGHLIKPLEPLIGPKSASPSGGSVVTDAIMLGVMLGCDPVITVGFDLAFTDDEWYAPGSFRTDQSERHPDTIEVPAALGGTVKTAVVYYTTLVWLDAYLRHLAPVTHFIDATEGGAKKKHFEIMPLAEAIEKYCQEPFFPREKIKKAHKTGLAWLRENLSQDNAEQILESYTHALETARSLTEVYADMQITIAASERSRFFEQAQQAEELFTSFEKAVEETFLLHTRFYSHLVKLAGLDTTGLEDSAKDKHLLYLRSSHEFWKNITTMLEEEVTFLRDEFMGRYAEMRRAYLAEKSDG